MKLQGVTVGFKSLFCGAVNLYYWLMAAIPTPKAQGGSDRDLFDF
jgi:hypothetical protein